MPHFLQRTPPPFVTANYQLYRPYVREDFRATCAYCLLKEIFAAGLENFEIDHFRPRSLFPERAGDYYNLYYSCHPCNRIKHDKWPSAEVQSKGIGFVDLCSDDFDEHFDETTDGRWTGRTMSAEYTIDALRLNRPHLVQLRLLLRAYEDQVL